VILFKTIIKIRGFEPLKKVISVVARFIELFSRPAKGGATTKIYLFDFIKLIFGFFNSQNSS